MIWLAIAAVGGLGAACRYVIDFALTARTASQFPWGTWAVNVSGSLLIGAIAGAVAHHGAPSELRVVLGAGFCGAYTTFSAFMYETFRLVEERAWGPAGWNLASIAAGVAATWIGWAATALAAG